MKRAQQGFSLVELMAVVAIVAILSAVAIPAYTEYMTRGRLTEAFTGLGSSQAGAEQFWANNRTYAGFDTAATFPRATDNFTYALGNASASGYTVTATGRGKMTGFIYTIDQNGNRSTTGVPSGWSTNAGCWVDKKGGQCSN